MNTTPLGCKDRKKLKVHCAKFLYYKMMIHTKCPAAETRKLKELSTFLSNPTIQDQSPIHNRLKILYDQSDLEFRRTNFEMGDYLKFCFYSL